MSALQFRDWAFDETKIVAVSSLKREPKFEFDVVTTGGNFHFVEVDDNDRVQFEVQYQKFFDRWNSRLPDL